MNFFRCFLSTLEEVLKTDLHHIHLKKVTQKVNVDKYIPPYVPSDLPWYKRDGLMMYIDRLKYERFSENRDSYLQRANIIIFDIIHHRCRGNELTNPVTYYKTIKKHDLNDFEKKEKEEALAAVARCKSKDL